MAKMIKILDSLERGGTPTLTGTSLTESEALIVIQAALRYSKDLRLTKDWILNVLVMRVLPSPQA